MYSAVQITKSLFRHLKSNIYSFYSVFVYVSDEGLSFIFSVKLLNQNKLKKMLLKINILRCGFVSTPLFIHST